MASLAGALQQKILGVQQLVLGQKPLQADLVILKLVEQDLKSKEMKLKKFLHGVRSSLE